MSSIFISYRRKDIDRLRPLLDAFETEGVEYWLDTRDVEPFEDFSDAVVANLSKASALIAWYSRDYPESRVCQWEFTAAFLAAQQETDPFQRVLVINPESNDDHLLLPQEIRGQNIRSAPRSDDAEGFKKLAREIAAHLKKISSPFGQIRPGEKPPYYGRKITHSERFLGRLKEFWNINWALHSGSDRTITAAAPVQMAQIIGLGGMGKSMFAEEYAARFGWAYTGGVFWIDAYGAEGRTPESMESFSVLRQQQLEAIARELGIEPNGLDKALLSSAIRRNLEERGKPYLWIVDDFPAGLDFSELGHWLAPDTAHGKTLITTRTTSYGKRGASIRLDRLDDIAAYRLLSRDREPEDPAEKEAAEGIVEDLGGHPLALQLAAAYLESFAGLTSFVDYRAILADRGEDALKLAEDFTGVLPSDHERSIAATMRHSLKQLGEEGLDFLRLTAQLSPAPIPATLVASTFAIADEIEEPKAKQRAALAFNQTEKHSFSQVVEPKQGLRVVHSLVSRVIRFDTDHASRCQALRAAAVQALNAVLRDVADIRTHRLLDHQVTHAREMVKQLENENDATLGVWVGRHDYEWGDYTSAHMLLEKALTLQQRLLGEEHRATLTSMNNLAATHLAQGDFSGALVLQEKALDIFRHVLGEEHPDTLTSMNNLAQTLWAQGDLSGARALEEKVLEIRMRVLGEEHPDTLNSINNLAETLRAQGDLSGARALQERVLESFRHVLGEEHLDTLTSMNNLAEILRTQGDFSDARTLHEKTLEIRRRVLGEEHPDASASAFNLFVTLVQSGAHEEALGIFQSHLAWLLKRDPTTLGADQRNFREQLVNFEEGRKFRISPPSQGKSTGKKKKKKKRT